jgi:hypothetical protein
VGMGASGCGAVAEFYRFEVSTIQILLADREFVGTEWLKFLNENNILFAIRIRRGRARAHPLRPPSPRPHLHRPDGHARRGRQRRRAASHLRRKTARGRVADHRHQPARAGLDAYRKRWAIECLFSDAKTRGLNLQDTRLTCLRKLDLLKAIVALTLVWAAPP